MSTYAKIEWLSPTKERSVLSVTRKDSKSHYNPVWDFRCKSQEYEDIGEQVVLTVFDRDKYLNRRVFIGSVTVPVTELLSSTEGSAQFKWDLLDKEKKSVGVIFVHAYLTEVNALHTTRQQSNMVKEAKFEVPVHRIGVSGGTAPFFKLVLSNPKPGQTPHHYIGKDLAHARDEFDFYEKLNMLKESNQFENMFGLLGFAFEYAGIFQAPEAGVEDGENALRELLVIRNLYDNISKLRLLDLKIGFRTADAGWQGKSWFAAKKQTTFIDNSTNSTMEGFRLEGFDGIPNSLFSKNPTIDGHVLDVIMSKEQSEKKARRHALQSMSGLDIMPYFLDLSELAEQSNSQDCYYPHEVSELVLYETCIRLVRLTIECCKFPVPQKWIGSSVALGFDCGRLPLRSEREKDIREKVILNIFDWGRSVLNTEEDHNKMSIAEQKNFHKFWHSYRNGIMHLSWDAAQYYFHRFGNTSNWQNIEITVLDYDGVTKHDLIGHVLLPARQTKSWTHNIVLGKKTRGTLTCSINWSPFPKESRFEGVWIIHIEHADNIPNLDTTSLSDPYCSICATSAYGHKFTQYSSVLANTLNPVWDEKFELPVMKGRCSLVEGFTNEGAAIAESDLFHLFGDKKVSRSVRTINASASANSSGNESFRDWERIMKNERVGGRMGLM